MGRREEDTWAAAAREGDQGAFGALVERFEGPLLRFLRVRCASRDDAEELAQETFLRAWQHLRRYDPTRSFGTWLFTLASRLSISALRKQRVTTQGGEALEGVPGDAGPATDPARLASGREQRANLWRVVQAELGVDQRTALWLRYGEGMGIDEIARVLDKRAGTVRVILFRARERLGEHLNPSAEPGTGSNPGEVPASTSRGRRASASRARMESGS